MSHKSVILRAFHIENNDPTRSSSGLFEMLRNKLPNTVVGERRMLLNDTDPDQEEDLISNFNIRANNDFLVASILRIRKGDETVSVPDRMFLENSFLLSELETLDASSSIYKDIQYLLVSDNIVIVCWFGNKTIKSVEAYINWFLENERGQFIFELIPVCKPVLSPAIKDIKEIVMAESANIRQRRNNQNSETVSSQIIDVKKTALNALFDDMPDLDETILEEMVSARLLIKFNKKPRNMSQEDYNRNFGALMKPISDLEDVKYITRKGETVKASEVLLTERVEVDLTSNKQVSENSLFLKMEQFLSKISNGEYE